MVVARRRTAALAVAAAASALAGSALLSSGAVAAPTDPGATAPADAPTVAAAPPTRGMVNGFAYGELQASAIGHSGCGTNAAGEPAIHVDRTQNLVVLGSENGLGSGSVLWAQPQLGGTSAGA